MKPVVTGILRPVTKGIIKGSLITYDAIKLNTAPAIEAVEDLTAEAKAELAESSSK